MGFYVKRIQIERKSQVVPEELAQEHLLGAGKPVLITDATNNWAARSKWTFEFFKTAYGADLATAWRGMRSETGKLTTLSAFISYLDAPLAELPGIWRDEEAPEDAGAPFYLNGAWYAFRQHPELYDDIAPAPYFVRDWVSGLDPTLRDVFEWTHKRTYSAIFIGPEGSVSPLHQDYWNTHAYLAQIQGRKRAILYSPADSEFLYDGRVDPEQPNFEQFPLVNYATAYECVIEPGETLLIPADWWHYVRGLEKSITVSRNFFNDTNFSQHMIHILRNLPILAEGVDRSPNWRERLGIKWRLSDFSVSGACRILQLQRLLRFPLIPASK